MIVFQSYLVLMVSVLKGDSGFYSTEFVQGLHGIIWKKKWVLVYFLADGSSQQREPVMDVIIWVDSQRTKSSDKD